MPVLSGLTLKVGAQAVSAAFCGADNVLSSVQALLFATHRNKYPAAFGTTAGTLLKGFSRYKAYIGSGDTNSLAAVFFNTMLGSSGESDNTNAITIESVSIERASPAAYAPVYFGGSRSVTLSAGQRDLVSDQVLPSAFGLTKFTRGELYYIRVKWAVTTAGHKFPQCRNAQEDGVQSAWRYDPAVTTGLTTDATGAFTWTGTTPTGESQSKGLCPMIVGMKPITQKVFVTVGDSIIEGTNFPDSPTFFQYAFQNASSGIYANGEVSAGGADQFDFTGANIRHRDVYKYGTVMCDELGTNGPSTTTLNLSRDIWTAAKAAGVKRIVRAKLLPRTYCECNVTAATHSGTTATLTTTAQLPQVGQLIAVVGFTPTTYNRVTTVTAVGAGAFSYTMASDPGADPSVNGTWSDLWQSEANQQYAAGGTGGANDGFNSGCAALVGTEIDLLLSLNSVRGTDLNKWKGVVGTILPNDSYANRFAVGTHPSTAAAATIGAEVAPAIDALVL